MDILNKVKGLNWKNGGIFAAGVLFGTAGVKILSSKDARKVYAQCTAVVLRAKDCVMEIVNKIQENAEDIIEEAKEINEAQAAAAAEEVIEDAEEVEAAVVEEEENEAE